MEPNWDAIQAAHIKRLKELPGILKAEGKAWKQRHNITENLTLNQLLAARFLQEFGVIRGNGMRYKEEMEVLLEMMQSDDPHLLHAIAWIPDTQNATQLEMFV